MTTHQQEQIEKNQQILCSREQRLKYLNQQQITQENFRLKHLKEQEIKNFRLKTLQNQINQQKYSNSTFGLLRKKQKSFLLYKSIYHLFRK